MLESDPNDRPPLVHERPAWLTYAQVGERLGLSPEAVRHRARRAGWRTQPGNDGRTLVMIPDGEATEIRPRPPVHTAVQTIVRTPDHPIEIARSHARSERAEQRADDAGKRADAALALADATLAQLTDASARADRAEAAIAGERDRADAADADRRAAQARAEHAEAARDRAEQGAAAERARADALRDRLNAQLVATETTDAHAAVLRDRLDAMQAQLTQAHAALQAAVETERRAGQAEAGREAERNRADALRDRIETMREQLAARQEVVDAAEAIRQADDARRALGRWARIRRAWRGE